MGRHVPRRKRRRPCAKGAEFLGFRRQKCAGRRTPSFPLFLGLARREVDKPGPRALPKHSSRKRNRQSQLSRAPIACSLTVDSPDLGNGGRRKKRERPSHAQGEGAERRRLGGRKSGEGARKMKRRTAGRWNARMRCALPSTQGINREELGLGPSSGVGLDTFLRTLQICRACLSHSGSRPGSGAAKQETGSLGWAC